MFHGEQPIFFSIIRFFSPFLLVKTKMNDFLWKSDQNLHAARIDYGPCSEMFVRYTCAFATQFHNLDVNNVHDFFQVVTSLHCNPSSFVIQQLNALVAKNGWFFCHCCMVSSSMRSIQVCTAHYSLNLRVCTLHNRILRPKSSWKV